MDLLMKEFELISKIHSVGQFPMHLKQIYSLKPRWASAVSRTDVSHRQRRLSGSDLFSKPNTDLHISKASALFYFCKQWDNKVVTQVNLFVCV